MGKNKYDALWDEHLTGCNQCNYGERCMACEVGEPYSHHSCNCEHGKPDNGYHLFQKTACGRRQARSRQIYDLQHKQGQLDSDLVYAINRDFHPDDIMATSLSELILSAVKMVLTDSDTRATVLEWITVKDQLEALNARHKADYDRDNGESEF